MVDRMVLIDLKQNQDSMVDCWKLKYSLTSQSQEIYSQHVHGYEDPCFMK